MYESLKDKVALVTGSSRGIGKATVLELAKNGCNVIINCSKSKEQALLVEQEIKEKYNVKTLVVVADLSNEDDVVNLIDTTINEFGKVDILVNNAELFLINP